MPKQRRILFRLLLLVTALLSVTCFLIEIGLRDGVYCYVYDVPRPQRRNIIFGFWHFPSKTSKFVIMQWVQPMPEEMRGRCVFSAEPLGVMYDPCGGSVDRPYRRLQIGAPLWAVGTGIGGLPIATWIFLAVRRRRIARSGTICVCGYELRGLTEPRCPECGRPFEGVRNRPRSPGDL